METSGLSFKLKRSVSVTHTEIVHHSQFSNCDPVASLYIATKELYNLQNNFKTTAFKVKTEEGAQYY